MDLRLFKYIQLICITIQSMKEISRYERSIVYRPLENAVRLLYML